ncbi:hypothetical protein LOZ80_38000 [Paenibacillus sp. HWE-109]|uniref:hypothetical protein n=1 Tax=Paenibacillus sp. HWE-109 TaxID=1306526 RepID=UPI001EDF374D|nr:hypothetical protein [Paenibacillus sp. HWE-109]UKS27186.1 hypothetical protein LOZ80_38000 [Paenibacillus sp. HWE-109]
MFTIFKAKIGPITVDEKKTVLKLIFPEEFDLISVYQLMKQKGKTVKIEIFSEEQLSIDDIGVSTPHRSGIPFVAGPSGIVERLSTENEQDQDDDQEQMDITDEPEEPEIDQESLENDSENAEPEPQPDFELEFDGQTPTGDSENDGNEDGTNVIEIEGKDALETFILNGKAPKYEDIPYDFPELLKRKVKGETWMEIATSLKITSTTLSAAWSKYRKQVKAYMEGDEHGAA